jgi:NADH dehydrogenase
VKDGSRSHPAAAGESAAPSALPGDPRARPARGTGDLLVTGATGLLGRQLCELLASRKHRFRALVRASSDRGAVGGSGAWLIEGDLTRRETLPPALDGVRQLVHLAAAVRERDAAVCRAVHVDGTRNLLDAAEAAGVRRIVAISSDSVLRQHKDAYAVTKAEADALLQERCRRAHIGLVLLRPPLILGPGSPHLAVLERLARAPVLPFPHGLAERRPVWAGDVAEAVLRALELPHSKLPERPLELPGPTPVQLGALVRAVARAHGWSEPRIFPLPTPAFAVDRLPRLAALREQGDMDPGPARRLLGWKPVSLEEALRRSVSAAL